MPQEYYFAEEINDTTATGIISIKTKQVICLCTEENSQILLPLLNKTQDQFPDNEADGIVFCGKCGTKKTI